MSPVRFGANIEAQIAVYGGKTPVPRASAIQHNVYARAVQPARIRRILPATWVTFLMTATFVVCYDRIIARRIGRPLRRGKNTIQEVDDSNTLS